MKLVLNGVSACTGPPWNIELHSVDLVLRSGELTVLTGPGGAGKSLLLDVIAGLVPLSAGEISCDGDRAPAIVYQPEVPLLPDHMTVRSFFQSLACLPSSRFGLAARASCRLDELPARFRRLLWLEAALSRRSDVYLFDEPVLGLDWDRRGAAIEAVRNVAASGASVLVATVDPHLADCLADRLVLMDGGSVVCDGTVTELETVWGGKLRDGLVGGLWRGMDGERSGAGRGRKEPGAMVDLKARVATDESGGAVGADDSAGDSVSPGHPAQVEGSRFEEERQ